MPNLPPLPLIDGCLFIDNSGWVEGMSTCNRYLQYKSLNLRIPTGEKAALNFGSAIHLGLEMRYKKYRNLSVDQQFYEDLGAMFTTFFAEHPSPAEDWRTLNYAMEIIRKYNTKYDVEEFNLLLDSTGQPMVEMSFALPLCAINTKTGKVRFDWDGNPKNLLPDEVGILYSGRLDLPIAIDTFIYVMDHKTSGQMGQQFWDEQRMSAQHRGYCWAFEQLTGRKVHGYCVNGIRTKEVPAYVSNNKSMSRGGKTYTTEGFWAETLQRERYILKAGELDEWKNNTISLVEEFFWHYQRDYMPMKTKLHCTAYGKCPYYDVCSLAPEDRGMMLASGKFTDNLWTPLKQPTQSMQ